MHSIIAPSVKIDVRTEFYMFVCYVMSEEMDSDPNQAFKVNEIFKEWFY